MSCAVWQSVQTGARVSPLASSWPWTLCIVGLLDAQVAFAAGFGDVRMVDGRIAIHRALDVVDAVAIVAGGRDNQPHLQQARAHGCCPCIATAASGCLMPYSSVSLALLWHLAQVCGRFSLKTGEAGSFTGRMSCEPWQSQQLRRAGSAHGVAHAVDAGGIFLRFLFVASRAIRRRQAGIMHQFFDAGVTVGAVELGVDGQVRSYWSGKSRAARFCRSRHARWSDRCGNPGSRRWPISSARARADRPAGCSNK